MEEGVYDIGQWLPNREGITAFTRLFSMPNLSRAMEAVNCLNGGKRISAASLILIFNEKE
jgi:hypothetical protein